MAATTTITIRNRRCRECVVGGGVMWPRVPKMRAWSQLPGQPRVLAIFLDRGLVRVRRGRVDGVAIRGVAMMARRMVIVRSLSTRDTEQVMRLGVMLRGGRPRVSRHRETNHATNHEIMAATRFRRRSDRAGGAMVTVVGGTVRRWIRLATTTLILWTTTATRSMATILTPTPRVGSVRAAGIKFGEIKLGEIKIVGGNAAEATTDRSVSSPIGFRLPAPARLPVWGRVVVRRVVVARLVDRHSVRWVVRRWVVAGSRGVMPRRVAARILGRLHGAAACVGRTRDVAAGTATKGRSIAPRIPT